MSTKKAPSSLTLFYLLLLPLLLLSFNVFSSGAASDHENNSAVSYSAVTSLPGLQGPLPFDLETGYVGVGESSRDELFYYFVESERNPDEDPLLLWLNGGPGCSALCGLVYEIGPFQFKDVKYEGGVPPLQLNPYAWTKVSNIIFADQPVGTGFSYSIGTTDYNNSDTKTVKQLHEFLHKWLLAHPRFISNPLYVGGLSYAGKIVPILSLEIINGNDDGKKPFLNFKGYFVGNAITGLQADFNSRVPFAHGMGLIPDELYESAKMNCDGVYVGHRTGKCAEDLQQVEWLVADLEEYNILYSRCPYDINAIPGGRRSTLSGVETDLLGMPISECWNYVHLLATYWTNNEVVKEALHVRKGTSTEWKRCKREMPYIRDIPRSLEYHAKVTSRGYRALVFSGDHDLAVPYIGTQAWIRSLNYSIIIDWHPWYADEQVGGYTRTYANNLTFATVKGAGHTAPQYKPKECLPMFRKWISGSQL